MENTTSRKVWETPKVFVLGAEGTQGFKTAGTNEATNHLTGYPGSVGVNSLSTFKGYQS